VPVENEELVERAKRLIEESEKIRGIEAVEATGEVYRWLYNTWIRDITNFTTSIIRIRNPERQSFRNLLPGTTVTVNWAAPWVDSPTELSNKALTVRAIPSGPGVSPTNPGTGLFRVFLDYDNEIVSWVPFSADHGMRNPIELTPGGGVFLTPVNTIDLNIVVVPPPTPPPTPPTPPVVVPGAVVVISS
jgi:hypothetical protein